MYSDDKKIDSYDGYNTAKVTHAALHQKTCARCCNIKQANR
ncbi:hypothetical protein M917_0089 [Psychrobacter aquaticus CMS 56]|uniref:Uncharacterized protein n=1 Tax=Psychrobacter aquaticus CMS 56 TaxID=1354303 RepID=U4T676_9GAMM|nr:hypothetical protein M917_0089 [Psychrobacter aquaticus CMS 56]